LYGGVLWISKQTALGGLMNPRQMASEWYILNEKKEPVPAEMMEAAKWLNSGKERDSNRRVAKTQIGDVDISTVFLGLDHQFGDGPPLVFETMIFGGEHDGDQWRYSTWDEAMKGHEDAVKLVSGS